jgi:hypothetical protein
MLSGNGKYTQKTDMDYDPPLKQPLDLSGYRVCNDFKANEE